MVYPVTKITLVPLAKLWIKKIKGKENIPKEKPFIFASNHASFYDDLGVPSVVATEANKRFHIYVNSRFFKNIFLKLFLNHYGCLPVDVKKEEKSVERNENAFKSALHYLQKGEIIGIFPEGHRSLDGKLQKAKVGVARLALAARVAVIPIGIKGSYEILPKGKTLPQLKRCEVHIGKPMYFDKYYGKENDKKVLRKVTTMIMKEIATLASQEYGFD